MTDYRIENLADIITNYSVNIKKDNVVFINGTEISLPLVKSVYKKVLEKVHILKLECIQKNLWRYSIRMLLKNS